MARAVVGREHDQCIVVKSDLLQMKHQLADQPIGASDLEQVTLVFSGDLSLVVDPHPGSRLSLGGGDSSIAFGILISRRKIDEGHMWQHKMPIV